MCSLEALETPGRARGISENPQLVERAEVTATIMIETKARDKDKD